MKCSPVLANEVFAAPNHNAADVTLLYIWANKVGGSDFTYFGKEMEAMLV